MMGQRHRILICDDEERVRTSLEGLLQDHGYEVMTASNSSECLNILAAQAFDLVILDIVMPDMDGIETLRKIKERYKDMEVIMITGYADKDKAVAALRHDAYDFLEKPVESKEILNTVAHCLSQLELKRDLEKRTSALRESKDFIETIFHAVNDSVCVINTSDFRIVAVNKSFLNMANMQEKDVIGKTCYEVTHNRSKPCEPPDHICPLAETLKTGEHSYAEHIHYDKDGRTIYVEVGASPIRDDKGEIYQVVHVARDISERKHLEEQRHQAQQMEAIATLAGGVAHQFNNALSVITGNIDLLEMDLPADENVIRYLESMKVSAHRMANLTSQLLAYARGGKYYTEVMSLSDFVEETLPLIQHTINPAIRVETDLPRDILDIEVDRTQMQMVLSALMANADEAIEDQGRIRIITRNEKIDEESAKNHPGPKPGPYVSLTVEDDGKGMDQETRSRIFDPFFTTRFLGRGLGMAAVYGIIRNHGGSISVDSELGKGTAVKIYLPAISPERKEQGAKVVKTPEVDLPTGEGTVLIIEDEEPLVKLFREILERLGYRVLEARTGEEAVEIARTFDGRIDLALLDIKLPDMSGNNIYPLIMEARPDLKVIVCSGYSIEGPARKILDAGAQDFIQKPFSLATLSEKLKKVLEGK